MALAVLVGVAVGVGLARAPGDPSSPSDGVTIPRLPDQLAPAPDRIAGSVRQPAPASHPAARVDLTLVPIAATVGVVDLSDRVEEQVEVDLAGAVADVREPSGFALAGYAGASVPAVDAHRVRGADDRVLLEFPPGTDVERFTLLTVAEGSVHNRVGEPNPASSVSLSGAGAAASGFLGVSGPRLRDARAHHTLEQATYVFDAQIDPARPVRPEAFGAVRADGRMVPGSELVAVSEDRVTVRFAEAVADVERFSVAARGAFSYRGSPVLTRAVGALTSRPDLMEVVLAPGRMQLDFVFDQPVANATVGRFAAYADDGRRFTGSTALHIGVDTVRVAFARPRESHHELVYASVAEGAVTTLDGATPGTINGVPLTATTQQLGRTAGPDPLRWRLEAAGQAVVTFDEPLDEGLWPDPEGIHLALSSGELVPAAAVIDVHGRELRVNLPPAAAAAAAALVVAGALVTDPSGNPNPPATLKR